MSYICAAVSKQSQSFTKIITTILNNLRIKISKKTQLFKVAMTSFSSEKINSN